jgi:hypothetical protein
MMVRRYDIAVMPPAAYLDPGERSPVGVVLRKDAVIMEQQQAWLDHSERYSWLDVLICALLLLVFLTVPARIHSPEQTEDEPRTEYITAGVYPVLVSTGYSLTVTTE